MDSRRQSNQSFEMNPLELQKFNLQAINQEGDSAHSLRYNKMEEYSPDYSKENSLIVSKINIKKKLQFEDLNEKEPNLFLEDITNTNNNYPSMDLTGRTGILQKEKGVIDEPQIIKIGSKKGKKNNGSHKIVSEHNTHKVIQDEECKSQENEKSQSRPIKIQLSKKLQNGQRQSLSVDKRMKTRLKKSQKQYYRINVEEGVFNDDIEIFFDGEAEKPMSSSVQKSFFVKKITVISEYMMIGRLQSNCSGSIFNVYEVDQEEMKRHLVATIFYESTFSVKSKPRKVEIYLLDPQEKSENYPDLNLKEYYEKYQEQKKVIKLKNLQPTYNESKDSYRLAIGTRQKALSSIHNCVLVNGAQKVLKFYQTQEKRYSLIIKNPLSPLIAYCYLLSSFCFKFSCQ